MPGISFVSAVTILSEIGDDRNFERRELLAAFSGLSAEEISFLTNIP
ncbi:MAG: transposase [Methanotrichaceae archaeon]